MPVAPRMPTFILLCKGSMIGSLTQTSSTGSMICSLTKHQGVPNRSFQQKCLQIIGHKEREKRERERARERGSLYFSFRELESHPLFV